MTDKIKVGIIGMGTIGPIHADAYNETGEAEIAALCDLDAGKLDRHGKRLGVTQLTTDYHELLASDVDAVSVCVPNRLHHQIAIDALRAGKHVLLEKPMALNATQAKAICQAAAKAKGVLQIGMVNRQRPEAQLLRQWVVDGQLGDIYHMRAVIIRRRGIPGMGGWFTTKGESGGGPMIDLGVHLFDMAMFLADQWKPTHASAMTYAKFGPAMRKYRYVSMWAGPPKFDGVFDVEDYSSGFARFPGQVTMSFEIAWAANGPDDMFVEVLGSKGGARVMNSQPLTVLTEHKGQLADISPRYSEKGNNFTTQARKFLAACRRDAPPPATGAQGLAVMKLIDAIYQSSKLRREVRIG